MPFDAFKFPEINKPAKIADKWNLFSYVINIRVILTDLRLPTL